MTDEQYAELRRFSSAHSMVDGERRPVPVVKCLGELAPPQLIEGVPDEPDRFPAQIFVCWQDLADLDRRLYADAALARGRR